jgi:hypothetical protein
MSTYCYKGKGAALPYDSMFAVLKRNINLATLISTDFGKLALASAPTVSLSSFTGFIQNDILELFEVPAGTAIVGAGVRVSTIEGSAAAAEMGYNTAAQTQLGVNGSVADPNAYGTFDLNDAETICYPLKAYGTDSAVLHFGDVYVTDGSIDLKFTTGEYTYVAAVFDVWAMVARVFEPVTSS